MIQHTFSTPDSVALNSLAKHDNRVLIRTNAVKGFHSQFRSRSALLLIGNLIAAQ